MLQATKATSLLPITGFFPHSFVASLSSKNSIFIVTTKRSYIRYNFSVTRSTKIVSLFIFFLSNKRHIKHLWIISITISCSSFVILLSLGKHKPLLNMSAPTSMIPPSFIYALLRARPLPFLVTNGFMR
jgi:hypothetical protein